MVANGGPGLAQGVHGLFSPSPILHPFLLSVHLSICLSSLPVTPPICLSACPSVPSQLLLVLSLSQSLERQLRAVLGPLVALQFHLLLLSLRGLLHLAQAKVWAGGEPEGLAGAGSVAELGASQAEGACYEGMGPPWRGGADGSPAGPWAVAELPGGAVSRVALSPQQGGPGARWLVGL